MPFTMPIQAFSRIHGADVVLWTPTAEDRAQALANHDQTLERLASRGGMSWCEMAAILEHRRHHTMLWTDAKRTVEHIVRSRQA